MKWTGERREAFLADYHVPAVSMRGRAVVTNTSPTTPYRSAGRPEVMYSEMPSTSHPFGLRGGVEGGTTPALAAVVNVIADALAELGVEHVERPATSERVSHTLRAARPSATR